MHLVTTVNITVIITIITVNISIIIVSICLRRSSPGALELHSIIN
jgi:hypothetical protein